MTAPRPRAVGLVLIVFGLVLLVLLGLVQSAGETRLNEIAIAAVWILGLFAVAAGAFMVIKNRRVRIDSGPPH